VDADGDADGDVDAEVSTLEPEKIELIKEHDTDMEIRKRRKVGADDYEEDDVDEEETKAQPKDSKAG